MTKEKFNPECFSKKYSQIFDYCPSTDSKVQVLFDKQHLFEEKEINNYFTKAVDIKRVKQYRSKFRYYYSKNCDDNTKRVTFIMLNPSSAYQENNDLTIKNCETIADLYIAEGFKGFEVVNLLPLRTSDPKKAYLPDKSHENNELIWGEVIKQADLIVPAWGRLNNLQSNLRESVNKIINKYIISKIDGEHFANKSFKCITSLYPRHPGPCSYNRIKGQVEKTKLIEISRDNLASILLN